VNGQDSSVPVYDISEVVAQQLTGKTQQH
jgi:hypothetical protein